MDIAVGGGKNTKNLRRVLVLILPLTTHMVSGKALLMKEISLFTSKIP